MRRVGFWGAGSEREGDSLASESLPELWQCYMYSPNATHPHRIYFLREIILFYDSTFEMEETCPDATHTHSSKYLISVITGGIIPAVIAIVFTHCSHCSLTLDDSVDSMHAPRY